MDGDDADKLFNEDRANLRKSGESFLLSFYGERCPSFCNECEICERWHALDVLTAEPGAIPSRPESEI